MIGSNFNALMNPGALSAGAPNPNVGNLVPVVSNRPAWATQGVYADGMKGFGQRFGDALKEPGMAHALLRGAAASFEGKGIGGALEAAGGSMDQTHATERQQQQQATENALQDRLQALKELTQQQQNDLGQQGLGVDRERVNVQRYGIDTDATTARRGQDVQRYGIDTSASTAQRGQDVDRANALTGAGASMSNAGTAAAASRYGSGLDYMAATDPNVLAARGAGIGSKGMPQFTYTVPSQGGGWFSGTPKTPAYKVRSPVPPGAGGGAPGAPEIRWEGNKPFVRDPVTGKPVPYTGG